MSVTLEHNREDFIRVQDEPCPFCILGKPERKDVLGYQRNGNYHPVVRYMIPIRDKRDGKDKTLSVGKGVWEQILRLMVDNVPPQPSRGQRFLARVPFFRRFCKKLSPPHENDDFVISRTMKQCGNQAFPIYDVQWHK